MLETIAARDKEDWKLQRNNRNIQWKTNTHTNKTNNSSQSRYNLNQFMYNKRQNPKQKIQRNSSWSNKKSGIIEDKLGDNMIITRKEESCHKETNKFKKKVQNVVKND